MADNLRTLPSKINLPRPSLQIPADLPAEMLHAAFDAAGYHEAALAGVGDASGSAARMDLEVVKRRTAGGSPFDTLTRLFLLGMPLPESAIYQAFAGIDIHELLSAGILVPSEGGFRSSVAIVPFDDLLIAHDFAAIDGPGSPDAVMGIGLSSIAVARLAPRTHGHRVLDLGAGSGYVALAATSAEDHVLATDLNPRALDFVRLNAWLNGRAPFEVRHGSLFEPVHSQTFDLILANPPFVISPETALQSRDSGMPGDTLSETVLKNVPHFLAAGGWGVVTCGWCQVSDTEWSTRPLSWLEGSGCDVWLLGFDTRDPLAYASVWLSKSARDDAAYSQALDRWMSYYEELGIRTLSWGCAIVRRPRTPRPTWTRADQVDANFHGRRHAEQIERIFASESRLQELTDNAEFLASRWKLVDDHILEHVLHAQENGWSIQAARIRLAEGFSFTGNVDQFVSAALIACDGTRTASAVLAAIAESLGVGQERIASSFVALLRTMIRQGFLVQSDEQRVTLSAT